MSHEELIETKKSKLDYIPSHNMDGKYAILMETSGEEHESWYYFIKVEGNEENLKHLKDQLDTVEWYIIDDLSTFDLETDYYISASTAKEMTKVDLNYVSFHRKFDGKLKKIDLGFTKRDGNDTKICKTFDVLGFGQIEQFIEDEDLDSVDLVSDDEENTDNESLSDENDEDSSEEDEDRKNGGFREEKRELHNTTKTMKLPPSLFNSKLKLA